MIETPITQLGLDARSLRLLVFQGITTIEQFGRLMPAQVYRFLPYCRAVIALARFRQWHDRRYPTPQSLERRKRHV